jgi:uncharacterized protein (DUF58 family)
MTAPAPQRRSRPVPTGRLVAVLCGASVVCLLAPAAVTVLVIADVTLLALALVDLALAADPARMGVERTAPAVIGLGREATLAWRVSNPYRRPVSVLVADQLAPSLRAGRRRFGLRVPRLGAAMASTVVRPTRRGRFTPTEVDVRTAGPLGLAARQKRRHLPAQIRVYPPFRSREEAELRVERARILEVGLRSAKGRGSGTEFEQLREWTPDDETRRLDWAATARTGKPIVRTYRAERNQTVIILLDNGRVQAGQVEGVPRVEHATDAALLLTYLTTRLGDRCGLVAYDQSVRAVVPPSHKPGQLGRVTEAVFDLEPALVESDHRTAFSEALARFRRRALFVILTDLSSAAVTETLLPALPLLARRHVVLVGSVRDPEVVGWAMATPTDASAVYLKAAAVTALDERDAVAARLRARGAIVVDEVPGRIAPALGDAYLDVKARGRL